MAAGDSYPLAPMSGILRVLTAVFLPLPAVLVVVGLAVGFPAGAAPLGAGVFVAAIYAWVWLWYRPSRFELDRAALSIVWPLRRRIIPRAGIASARILDSKRFREEFGTAWRIGAGGLWGGFGMLWTSRRGMIDFYISRTDRYVILEGAFGRPLMITPDRPTDLVAALTDPFPT
jgi:hypothetical protein